MGSCAVAVDSGGGGAEGLEHKAEGQGFILGTWGAKQKTMGTGQQGGPGVWLLWMATTSRQPRLDATSLASIRILPCPEPAPSLGPGPVGWSPTPVPRGRGWAG